MILNNIFSANGVSSISEWFKQLWEGLVSLFVSGQFPEGNYVVTSFLGKLVIALCVAVPLYIIVKLIVKLATLKKKNISPSTKTYRNFIISVSKVFSYCIIAILFLSILGLDLSGLSTIISSAVVAIGLSLQDIISNFASGVIIITSKRYLTGDYISLNGNEVEGTVRDIRILDTKLLTPNNIEVSVPNSILVSGKVSNYNVMKYRRIDLTASVTYGVDIDAIKKILLYCVNTQEGVNKDMSITVFVRSFSASSIDFGVRCYVTTSIYWDVTWSLNEKIYEELVARKVDIPYNQLDVHIVKDSKVAKPITSDIKDSDVKVASQPVSADIDRNTGNDNIIDSLLDNFEKSSANLVSKIKTGKKKKKSTK